MIVAGEKADMDVDGSWVDVVDEDVVRAKAKGKGPMEGPVVEEAPPAAQHESDSD